jgi:hypothetical protein
MPNYRKDREMSNRQDSSLICTINLYADLPICRPYQGARWRQPGPPNKNSEQDAGQHRDIQIWYHSVGMIKRDQVFTSAYYQINAKNILGLLTE